MTWKIFAGLNEKNLDSLRRFS